MLFSGNFEGQWKKNEKRESCFVFIGKDLIKDDLRAGFEACLVTKELRIADGDDSVFANVGGYMKGKVLKRRDDGNAYRIQLEDGTNVWAPVDIDLYVRSGIAAYE